VGAASSELVKHWEYDDDGRATVRTSAGPYAWTDTLEYDWAGRVVRAQAAGEVEATANWYNGLGALRFSDHNGSKEAWLVNGAGNAIKSCTGCDSAKAPGIVRDTNAFTNNAVSYTETRFGDDEFFATSVIASRDHELEIAPRVTWTKRLIRKRIHEGTVDQYDSAYVAYASRNWYGADGKVRVFQGTGSDSTDD